MQLLALGIWMGSLLFAYTTFRQAWDARLIVPFLDEWDFLAVYRHTVEARAAFADLWTPVNGHYEPIPRLLFQVRDTLLGGEPIALMLVCALLQTALIGIIVVTLLSEPRLEGMLLRTVLGAASVVLLTWSVQLENFHWGVQITFVLPAFLAVASVALVCWRPPAAGIDWPVVAAAIMAVCACFSLGAGLGIWPALLLVALTQRRGARAIAIILLGAVLSATPYLLDGTGRTLAALTMPLDLVLFIFRNLSPPYAEDGLRLSIGAVLTVLGLFTIGRALTRGVSGRLDSLGLGLVTFGLSVSLLTAIARVDEGEPAASRYFAFSSIYWVGLMLVIGLSAAVYPGRSIRWTIKAGLLYAFFPVMTIQNVAAQPFISRADQSTAAVLSVLSGTPDERAIGTHLHPRPHVPLEMVPFLVHRKYGFFGDPLVQAIGTPVADRFPLGADRCDADVRLEVQLNGLRLSGHYRGPARPSWLVIVGPAGHVRGLAVRDRRGGRFTGYLPARAANGTVYGVQDGRLCHAASLGNPGQRDGG